MVQTDSTEQKYPRFKSWRIGLTDAAKKDLEKCLQTRVLQPGETLYYIGESAQHGYQVMDGEISLNSYTSDGRELVLGTFGPGHCLGDTALVNEGSRFNTAIAATKAKVNSISRSEYNNLCIKHPEIAVNMAEMMGYRFQFLFSLLQDACLLPIYERLGRILVRMALVENNSPPTGKFTLHECSQEKLGQMVGAARQSVGREMKKMETAGLIKIEYKSVTLLDFEALTNTFGKTVEFEPLISAYFEGPKP